MWYACFDFEKKRKRKNKYKFEWPADTKATKWENAGEKEDEKLNEWENDPQNDYLENPELYRIGIDRTCFSRRLFVQWVIYALWHAFVIHYTVLYVLCNPETHKADGKDIGFWLSGMAIYGVCIMVANLEIAIRFNTHNVLGVLCILAGVVCYFLSYGILSAVF